MGSQEVVLTEAMTDPDREPSLTEVRQPFSLQKHSDLVELTGGSAELNPSLKPSTAVKPVALLLQQSVFEG